MMATIGNPRARSGNTQLVANMLSSSVVFAVNLCITFFLTPFIVAKLGTAAYGFIGLTNNILGYTSLITIAVNSMAGRFITIKVHSGDIDGANRYLSSVFYVNLGLSALVMTGVIVSAIWLEDLINIPTELIGDVKALYVMLGVTTCLSLITGVISVGAFIRNRLDITNSRDLFGSLIRVVVLLLLFGFFVPRLWYFGITALIMSLYVISSNYYFFRILTPELKIRIKLFSFASIIELVSSGAWNIINKISNILTRGCELLLSNLFVSARAMGQLSLALPIPGIILSFFGAVCGSFSPELTRHYAQGNVEALKNELFKAIRIAGFLSAIPISISYALGDVFFSLWIPDENVFLIYLLSIAGSIELMFGLPIEPLWNIFVITNHVRQTSLYQLGLAIVTFAIIIGSMFVFEDEMVRLFLIAGIHSALCIYRNLTFLPRFGAKCLGLPKGVFYPLIARNLINIIVITSLGFVIKNMLFGMDCDNYNASWSQFFVAAILTVIIGIIASNCIILSKNDRTVLYSRFRRIIGK